MPAAPTALRAQKRALRKSVQALLNALPDALVEEQSRLLTERLLQSSVVRRAQNIALFLNMPHGEPRTDDLARALLERGKNLYLPRIVPVSPGPTATVDTETSSSSAGTAPQAANPPAPSTIMQMLRVYNVADLDAIRPAGPWGLREPSLDGRETAGPSTLDLILCPGVAFDKTLPKPNRLGHGKGYYDTFISSLGSPPSVGASVTPVVVSDTAAPSSQEGPTLVAVALREQLLEDGQVPVSEQDVPLDAVVTPDGWFPEEPRVEQ